MRTSLIQHGGRSLRSKDGAVFRFLVLDGAALFARADTTASMRRAPLDFLQKLSRLKERRELSLIQSEFVSRQAQVLGEGGKEMAQTIVQGTGKIVQKASDMTK